MGREPDRNMHGFAPRLRTRNVTDVTLAGESGACRIHHAMHPETAPAPSPPPKDPQAARCARSSALVRPSLVKGSSGEGPLQLVRYGIVGVVTNGLLFSGYLLLSSAGMGAKGAMTLLYVPGVLLAFVANRSFTFRHDGRIPTSLVRYLATYAFGYAFNLASLVVFVDILGLPAKIVVLALIFVTAGLLFVLQRCWVFPARASSHATTHEVSPR